MTPMISRIHAEFDYTNVWIFLGIVVAVVVAFFVFCIIRDTEVP